MGECPQAGEKYRFDVLAVRAEVWVQNTKVAFPCEREYLSDCQWWMTAHADKVLLTNKWMPTVPSETGLYLK